MFKKLVRFFLKNHLLMAIVLVLSAGPAAFFTTQLYQNLRPDLEELLPKTARSVQDLGEIRQRLIAIDNLAVIVLSEHTTASKRFIVDLAKALEKQPKDTLSGVEYKIDEELRFFDQRKSLFVDLDDLRKIEQFIAQKVSYEKSLYNPLNIFAERNLSEPKLDLKALLSKYQSQASNFSHFPGGYYATPDEKKRAALVYLPATRSGIEGVYRLKKVVEETIQRLDPARYAPDLKILYTGGVQNTIEEHSALIEDIETSAEIVFTVVTVALLVFFRSFLAVGALFISLLVARFWTFAATYFSIGFLNANSAFMGSIVLGSGITFGIILLSRYLEERRAGRPPQESAEVAIEMTSRATWTAALAAGFAYASLVLTEFEGFRQYGIIGFMGMIFCWISSVILCPCLLLCFERIRPLVSTSSKSAKRGLLIEPVVQLCSRFPWFIVLGSIGLSLASAVLIARVNTDRVIETNLSNLRNKKSMTEGSGYNSKYLDEIFQRYLSPVAALGTSEQNALAIAQALKTKQTELPQLINSVRSIHDFIPPDQKEKIHTLQRIKKLLPPQILSRLEEKDRKLANEFLAPEAMVPMLQKDLPNLVLNKFTEKDGSIGKLVLIEPPLHSSQWSGAELDQFVSTIRDTSEIVSGVRIPVAGGLPITSDMLAAVSRDGPKATLVAFLAVVVLLLVLFRKPSIFLLNLFALVIGNLWMLGWVAATGFKINFLNFIALPITFGIGVDYGVNIFHRYLHEPTQDILKVVRETGAAVALCSFTTITGYSSLLVAGNQAFVSFGWLAIVGEITTLIAAMISLPALLVILSRRRELAGRQV